MSTLKAVQHANDDAYIQELEERLYGVKDAYAMAMESYHFDNHTGPSHMCMEDACAYLYDLRIEPHAASSGGKDRGFAQGVQFLRERA